MDSHQQLSVQLVINALFIRRVPLDEGFSAFSGWLIGCFWLGRYYCSGAMENLDQLLEALQPFWSKNLQFSLFLLNLPLYMQRRSHKYL
jgi:hypothetical protein